MKSRGFIFSLLTAFLFSSCDKPSSDFTIIQTSSDFDYYSIVEMDDQLIIAGGDVWTHGDLSTSKDGKSWETQKISDRVIFDLLVSESQLFAIGPGGDFYTGGTGFQKVNTNTTAFFRSITSTEAGLIAVAGKDFNKGWIYTLDENYSAITEHQYDHELADVICSPANQCTAVGYGIILYSDDAGVSWTRSEQSGDYYNSLAYNKNGRLFTVGYDGSILQSDDHGKTWITKKNGHSPLANNTPFRKIKFYDSNGFIIGDNGTIWNSTNDGQSWQDISIDTDLELFDFVLYNDQLIIATEGGQIITISL